MIKLLKWLFGKDDDNKIQENILKYEKSKIKNEQKKR
tara:strand:- start:1718 stop:1828 length:111 start_codon:yes stop_codon:yes gene_type:complete